jgi:hypothetical protein
MSSYRKADEDAYVRQAKRELQGATINQQMSDYQIRREYRVKLLSQRSPNLNWEEMQAALRKFE